MTIVTIRTPINWDVSAVAAAAAAGLPYSQLARAVAVEARLQSTNRVGWRAGSGGTRRLATTVQSLPRDSVVLLLDSVSERWEMYSTPRMARSRPPHKRATWLKTVCKSFLFVSWVVRFIRSCLW